MGESLEIGGLDSARVWDYENGFFSFASPIRHAKFLAHYMCYAMAKDLPGCMVEFGVYKGNSLMQLLGFREMFETAFARPVYAFDMFGSFPQEGIKDFEDIKFINNFVNEGGKGNTFAEISALISLHNYKNVELIAGNVLETFSTFLESHGATRFNLVHLDLDVYEPTCHVLDLLLERMVKGGVIMFDDYGAVKGATIAVDEFLDRHRRLKLKKLDFSHRPAFLIVE